MSDIKLTQFKALLFDVYATLIDWENGLYDALKPMLQRVNSRTLKTKSEALLALSSVETDLQAKYPTMLYRDILAHAHAELAARLKGEPSRPDNEQSIGVTEISAHPGGSTTAEITEAGSSAEAESSAPGLRGLTEEDIVFGASIPSWPPFPDTIAALASLSKHFKLAVLSNVDHESFAGTRQVLEQSDPNNAFEFDAVYTAQEIGSYKPDTANFEYALRKLKEEFGIEKHEVLVTAASLRHDHVPANQLGIRSVFISRKGAVVGVDAKAKYDFRFDTLGEMAEQVERAAQKQ